jgi:hypothetical protein
MITADMNFETSVPVKVKVVLTKEQIRAREDRQRRMNEEEMELDDERRRKRMEELRKHPRPVYEVGKTMLLEFLGPSRESLDPPMSLSSTETDTTYVFDAAHEFKHRVPETLGRPILNSKNPQWREPE